MTSARDERLYAWENRVVAPLDRATEAVPSARGELAQVLQRQAPDTRLSARAGAA